MWNATPALFVLAQLAGCVRPTDKGVPETGGQESGIPSERDDDGDGYDTLDDCDDDDPDIHPGVEEECDGIDNDCDDKVDEDVDVSAQYQDLDGDGYGDDDTVRYACESVDGYVPTGGDCDDADSTIHPGVDETCDGVDQDCDGEIDEDATDALRFYADADADGYGDGASPIAACELPIGYIDNSSDCDDADPSIHPGADETCDDLDDDCDGEIDEDAIDAPTWRADADMDGYGDPSSGTAACAAPAGMTLDDTDCDDADAGVHLGADETCDDLDDDCDGEVDEDSAVDAPTWYADADVDGWGDALSTAAACAAPAGYVGDDTDCDDADPDTHPEADETCDDADQDCDGEVDEDATDASRWYLDLDGDSYGVTAERALACSRPSGYRAKSGDCDDDDASVHPGASEVCDDVDEDCDGVVDDDALDAPDWYPDEDGDGYGDPDAPSASCEAPAGFGSDDGDCDDADADVHPGADETCDDLDDDCDGVVDNDAIDAPTWYLDGDDDGYGRSGRPKEACALPSGYAALGGDCDDGDLSVYPGAVETCDDVDEDCDGVVDDGAVDPSTWYQDDDGDGYGQEDVSSEACDAPGGTAALPGDCDDGDGSVNPGASEVCDNGTDDDCDGSSGDCALSGESSLSDADAVLTGEKASDKAGIAVAFAGDVDGDGLADLLIGASGNDRKASASGAAYLVLGAPAGALSLGYADAILVGEAGGDGAGEAVAGGADLDGDGYDDLLLGASANDAGGTDAGAAWIVEGPVAGTLSLSAADTSLIGEDASDNAGDAVVALGDLDGDGLPDLGVGAPTHSRSGIKGGASYVVSRPGSGDVDLSRSDAMIYGATAFDYASAPADGGDVDGDGVADLLVGARGDDSAASGAGVGLLFLGPLSGDLSTDDADGARYGLAGGDGAGSALAGVGDSDGDGLDDVVIGASKADYGALRDSGAAYLLLGAWSGSGSLSEAEATLYGGARGDELGGAVARAGDSDGDGLADLLVGSANADGGGTDSGAAWLALGPLAGISTTRTVQAGFLGEAASDYAGSTVAGGGDADGDGKADLLIGAYDSDRAASNAGAAFLVLGAGL